MFIYPGSNEYFKIAKKEIENAKCDMMEQEKTGKRTGK